MTTIMVSHDKATMGLVDRTLVLADGEIVQDLYAETLSKNATIEAEVLEVVEKEGVYLATLFIANDFVEISLSKEEAKRVSVGDFLPLKLTL